LPGTIEDVEPVVLDRDHPGFADQAYRVRRNTIAAASADHRPGDPIPTVDYTDVEHAVWRTVSHELAPKHEAYACREYRYAQARLALPTDRVPQLSEVSARLERLTSFSVSPVPGLVPTRTFYGSLADRRFLSTQYVRHPSVPLYTPEPDIIHEVIGHGHLLATPTFSELHRLTGEATHRLRDDDNLRFLSKVFWFSVEFGVVVEAGEVRAYGAGILSSYGEIEEFRDMEHRPLDLVEMGTADYDITHYQPVLYRAESLDEVREVVGTFFRTCTDESIAEMRAARSLA